MRFFEISKIFISLQIFSYLESNGVNVTISKENAKSESSCRQLFNIAQALGPIDGIFNLAAEVRSNFFENQTVDDFDESIASKYTIAKYLDQVSNEMCSNLTYFVAFSSIYSGVGFVGSSSYGMANSLVDEIMYDRYEKNLPAKSIQFGLIADVGLVKDFFDVTKVLNVLPQTIASCFNSLDDILSSNKPVIMCLVAGDQDVDDDENETKDSLSKILKIMGVTNKSSISMDTPIWRFGINSLTSLEIQQFLELEFKEVFAASFVRNLTLADIEQKRFQTKN